VSGLQRGSGRSAARLREDTYTLCTTVNYADEVQIAARGTVRWR